MASGNTFDFLLKIVIIGDQSVGKSSLLLRYADGEFNQQSISTIGVDFKIKTLRIKEKTVKLQIWDTAGQEKFRNITTSYYRGSHGIILVFDLTQKKTFESLHSWIEEIKRHVDDKDVQKLIVGNKADLGDKREVSKEALEGLAARYGVPFLETSAKDSSNVEEAFLSIATHIIERNIGGVGIASDRSARDAARISLEADSLQESEKSSGCCG